MRKLLLTFVLALALCVPSLAAETWNVGTWKTAQTIQPFLYAPFADGAAVKVHPFTNPGDQKAALLAGSLDMTGTTLALAIQAASRGEPIVLVASLGNKCSALVVRKDGGVKSVADLKGKKILVTAGPTQEPIDPVRYLTNHSSGKMGYAIAKVCSMRGAEVTLVSGKTAIKPPLFVDVVPVTTAREMYEAVTGRSDRQDIVIKAAAVADYRPKTISEQKVKKTDGELSIEMERTNDILKYLGEHKRANQFLCGFSMETEHMLENSRKKLKKKNLDMIVANNVKVEGAGFAGDTNIVTLITGDDETQLPLLSKEETAVEIMNKILEQTEKQL